MKALCHQIADPAEVLELLRDMRVTGAFEITVPLDNPHQPWPKAGDLLAIHMRGTNITMMAFVRGVHSGYDETYADVPHLRITAGFKHPQSVLSYCPPSLR